VKNNHLLIFDLSLYGHHPGYIKYLTEYWSDNNFSCDISVVVSPKFLVEHSDVVELSRHTVASRTACGMPGKVNFIAMLPEEEKALASRDNGFKRNWRNFQEWWLFCKYAKSLKVDHGLIMYLDTYQLPIALGYSPPCPISGIYFRPTFHYPQLSGKHPSRREQVQQTWERVLLHRVLHNRKFRNLFSLDPFAIKYIDDVPAWASVLHLPDPVRLDSPPADLDDRLSQLRRKLGIDSDRQVFLMFGALTARKGIYKVLDSISLLPEDVIQNMCLLLVGEADDHNREQINHQVDSLCRRYPIQIIRHYNFVPDSEIPFYFHLSDIILATYQRHVGMSGILIWAASTGKPVISSDYGLMGETVKQHQLGTVLNAADPKQIAEGIQSFIDKPCNVSCTEKPKSFAKKNAHYNFSKLIFQCLNNYSQNFV
jgi:glycosyltransferase involved in cell wall biosynthesis